MCYLIKLLIFNVLWLYMVFGIDRFQTANIVNEKYFCLFSGKFV